VIAIPSVSESKASEPMSTTAPPDLAKAQKHFHHVVNKSTFEIRSSREAITFIHSVIAQSDVVSCLQSLILGVNGLPAIQKALSLDTTPAFINNQAVQLIQYFKQDRAVETIQNGKPLQKLLSAITTAPFFWEAFTKCLKLNNLSALAAEVYAWLLLRAIHFPKNDVFLDVAKNNVIMDLLLINSNVTTRTLARKIQNTLAFADEVHRIQNTREGPGGRHDNDWADITQIAITPTVQELASTQQAFLRTANYLVDSNTRNIQLTHIDNQFRLLREDMLAEIKEETNSMKDRQKPNRKRFVIKGLRFAEIDTGAPRKRTQCGLRFQCTAELPILGFDKLNVAQRLKRLKTDLNVVRHENMVCIVVDEQLIAIAAINRKEDELAQTPALITVQLSLEHAIPHILETVKHGKDVSLVEINAPLFAYEPFLRKLKEMNEVPLADQLLNWERGVAQQFPSCVPTNVIQHLARYGSQGLDTLLQTSKVIDLDRSQIEALRSCLSHKVSLIQGPPGNHKIVSFGLSS